MFSMRNNFLAITALALLGMATPLMPMNWLKGKKAEPTETDAKKAAQTTNGSDAESKTTAADSKKSGYWFGISPNIEIDKDTGSKIQTAAEAVKKFANQLVRQNEMRTFLREMQTQLAKIKKELSEPTDIATVFKRPENGNPITNPSQQEKETKREHAAQQATPLSLQATNSPLAAAMEPVIKLKTNFAEKLKPIIDENAQFPDADIEGAIKELQTVNADFDSALAKKTMPAYTESLDALKTKLDKIAENFMKKSLLGGLSDSLEENIRDLGKVLDKVVINLSSDLSQQLKVQLNEVVGYSALIKISEKLNDLLKNATASGPDMIHTLGTLKADIDALKKVVQQSSTKGELQTALEGLYRQITDITEDNAFKQSGFSWNGATVETLRSKITAVKNNANVILSRHGGLAVALRDTVDRLDASLDKLIKQLNNDLNTTLDRNITKLNTGFDKTLRKFVGFASCAGLAVYSTIFLMNKWKNPTDRYIGLGTLGVSLAGIPVISKLVNWLCK